MKKIASITRCLALCFTMFIGHTDVIKAENTDISEIENVAYIAPFEARQGSQIELSVRMKNAVGIRGYEFDLSLPEGMTFVRDGETNGYIFKTNADRAASYGPAGNVSDNDRTTHVLGSTLTGVDISGNDGEILTVIVNVDESMELGDYEITMTNIDLGTQNTLVSYKTAEVKTTVTIVDYVVINENYTVVPETVSSTTVKVTRTLTNGRWSTICLPFPMSAQLLKENFGDDYVLAEWDGCEVIEEGGEITGVNMTFTKRTTALVRGTPYIIKASKDVSEFVLTGRTVNTTGSLSKDITVTDDETGEEITIGSFIGTYKAETIVPNNCLFINNNKFYYSTGKTKMKAFRAYFSINALINNTSNARVILSVDGEDGNTTKIDARTMEPIETGKVYNMAGQYVGELENTDQLPKGIYIMNGKKVIK